MATLTTRERIRRIQRHLGVKDDGLIGPVTLSKIEQTLGIGNKTANLVVSKRGLDMLIEFEISSESYYRRKLSTPIWPGGVSGVTVGIGYDLGYNTAKQIEKEWTGKVSDAVLQELRGVSGITGVDAREAAERLQRLGIKIPLEAAKKVFFRSTLPRYAEQTRKAYPGIEKLPHDAQAALLSLIYNRGPGKKGSRRREMKTIEALVIKKSLDEIARQIRSMKRLWIDRGLEGLLKRRDKEAAMMEASMRNYNPDELVYL